MKSNIKRNILIVLCLILTAVCVLLYVYIYVIPRITGSLTETVILTYGDLQSSIESDALIIRQEYVVNAEHDGTASYYVEDSEKTRKYTKILDIYPKYGRAVNYQCPETGFIGYYLDGYEAVLSPDTIQEIALDDYYTEGQLTEITPADCRKETVLKGEPLYKLVSSDVWYMVAFVPEGDESGFEWGKTVSVTVGGKTVAGTVASMIDKGDTWLIVISTKQYYEDFAKLRTAHVTIIKEDSQGLIVPNTALAVEDGNVGVYVKNINDEYVFKRVEIVATGETESLLTQSTFTEKDETGETVTVSTVNIYDEVLRKPDNSYFAER